ncbi:MAG: Glu-tRNA(Gln) amidotransferase subunit GatD [DPANN group archaeon]|nr:Glu-tRNA(Gln) amidotransferase subunit GatD [DPANN group archaeon]
MYSKQLEKVLKDNKIAVGDPIQIEKHKKLYQGVLMPGTETQANDTLMIKLVNGYNVGISIDATTRITKSAHPKQEKEKHEHRKQDKTKPSISLVSTGGTIASRVDYTTGGVSPALDAHEIIDSIPELLDFVYIADMTNPMNVASEDILPSDWQNLAKELEKKLNSDIEGVVVTHGTDTMHYTTAAMSFMLDTPKPVVFVGSQRSSDRPSSDASMNLLCASYLAGYSDIAEIGVCMHANTSDSFCLFNRGTKVKKLHTSRRDAFRPINDLPLARVFPHGEISILNKNYKKKSDDAKARAMTKFEDKVAIIKAYPGCDPEIIDHYVSKGYRGLVVEATGLGHVPTNSKKSWKASIQSAIKKDVIVAFAPQTQYGRLDPNVYANGRIMKDSGVVYCEDMLPETAYVKLGWLLGNYKNIDEARQLMAQNLKGEITARTLPETFLY